MWLNDGLIYDFLFYDDEKAYSYNHTAFNFEYYSQQITSDSPHFFIKYVLCLMICAQLKASKYSEHV
jgi:hypothetical protein